MKMPLAFAAISAAMFAGLTPVSSSTVQAQPIIVAPFFWSGHRYCWYDSGWRGPGWYWCGYAWHRGYGWGGGYGWRGHGGHWGGHGNGGGHGHGHDGH